MAENASKIKITAFKPSDKKAQSISS